MSEKAESRMKESDWEDISESEFYDIAEGVSSFAVIFEHEKIGLHGIQIKKTDKKAILSPKSFEEMDEDTTSCEMCGGNSIVDDPDNDSFDDFDAEEPPWDFGCRDCGYAWSKGENE